MTSSYDLGKSALENWRRRYGDESLRNQCIRFDGYYWSEAYQGNENIRSYDSATAAADASPMYTEDVNDPNAEPGDLWYYDFAGLGNAGHVGTVLGHDEDGRVLITHTSSSGDLVEQWTNNVRISHADTIPHRFRGGSHHYGANQRRSGLTSWPTNSQPTAGGLPMFATYWTGPTTKNTAVSGRLITGYGSFWVYSPQIMGLLQRRHDAALKPGTPDNMLDGEHEVLNNFLRACFQSAQTGVQLDPVKMTAALTDALKSLGRDLVVTADAEINVDDLAAAFEIATPRIVNAMLRQAGEAMAG